MPKSARADAIGALQKRGSYSDKEANVIDWTYWDSLILASGTNNHRLFTIPFGQAGKTKAQTTWINANNLPQGQSFDGYALKIFYRGIAARDSENVQMIYDVLFNTVATIKVPGKDSLGEWLLAELMGLSMGVHLIPTVGGDNIPLALPKFTGVFPLNKKLTIGSNQTIEIDITHYVTPNAELDGDKIYIGINGLLLRLS